MCPVVSFIFDSTCLGEFVHTGLLLFMCLCVLLDANKRDSAEKTCGLMLQNNVLINAINATGSCSALSDEIKNEPWMRCHYQLTAGPLAFNYTTLWVKSWRLWSRCWIKCSKTTADHVLHTEHFQLFSVLFWPNMGLFLASLHHTTQWVSTKVFNLWGI